MLQAANFLKQAVLASIFENVTLRLHRAGGDKLRYFEVELEQVMITDFNQSGHQGTPIESVQLSYGKINTTYTRQDRHTGEAMGALSGGWDLIQNRHYA
jgi:type VI secretion system secreted protein Hcp